MLKLTDQRGDATQGVPTHKLKSPLKYVISPPAEDP